MTSRYPTLGVVTGDTQILDVTLSLDTSAYVTGDLLADAQEIKFAVREGNATGMIQSVTLLDKDDKAVDLDLYFTNDSTSWGTENSALAVTDAIADSIYGIVSIVSTDYTDLVGSQIVFKNNLGMIVKGDSAGSLYVAAACRGSVTYTASGITLRIGILRD